MAKVKVKVKTKKLLFKHQESDFEQFVKNLKECGYELEVISGFGDESFEVINNYKPELILMEINSQNNRTIVDTVKRIEEDFKLPIVYLSDGRSGLLSENILQRNVYGLISKHDNIDNVIFQIDIALKNFRSDQKNANDKYFLKEAQKIAKIGHWKLDLELNSLEWSDETYRIFEIDKSGFKASYEAFIELVHPDDRELVNQAYQESVKNKTSYEIEHRLLFGDGSIKYVREKGKTFYDTLGNPAFSIGTVQDISRITEFKHELDQRDRNFKELFLNSIDELYIVDPNDFAILEVNNVALKKLGYDKSELLEKSFFDLLADSNYVDAILCDLRAITPGNYITFEADQVKKNNTTYPVKVKLKKIVLDNYELYLIASSDISHRKLLELERFEQFQIRKIMNQLLSIEISGTYFQRYLQKIALILLKLPFLNEYSKTAIFIKNKEGLLEMKASVNFRTSEREKCAVIESGECVCGEVFKTGESIFRCCENDYLTTDFYNDYSSHFNIPITHNNELLGTFCVYSGVKEERSENHVNTFETIGKTIGLILARYYDHTRLLNSENRFRELTETIKEVFWLIDWNSKEMLYVSPAYEDIYEQSCQSLIDNPKSWSDNIHPEDKDKVISLYRRCTDGLYDVEFRLVMPDGRIKWIHERAFPIFEKRKVVRVAGYSVEVTDKKLMEVELKRSEEKYRTYVENSADIITIADLNYNVLYISPNNEFVFGYKAVDYVGKNVSDFVHPEDKKYLDAALQWLLDYESETKSLECRIRHKNGTWIWVESSIKYLENKFDTPHFIVNSRDISARKEIEKHLKKSEERFRLLYNNSLSGLYRINANNVVLECNQSFANILGYYDKDSIVNKRIDELFESDNDIYELLLKNNGEIKSFENYLTLKNGKRIRLLENAKIIYDNEKIPLYYEGSIIDTTSLLEIEREKRLIEVLPQENPNPLLRLDYEKNILFINDSGKKIRSYISKDNRISNKRICRFIDRFIESDELKSNIELKAGKNFFLFYAVHIKDQGYINLYGTDITELENSKAAHLQLSLDLENLVIERTNELKKTVDDLNKEIATRREAELKIQQSLSEKEVLLNEITHRVKNNLQVIASLLSLQKNNIENQETIELLSDTGHRIRSMALIHETLYRSNDFSHINFKSYIESLVRYIANSFDTRNIHIRTEIKDVILTIDTATSCGMIVMELMTNAIKYAFPDKKGKIELSFEAMGDNYFKLIIRDNGVGFPKGFNTEKFDTLGMQLVIGLTRQLSGKIDIDNNEGALIEIIFQDTKRHKYD